MAAHGPNGEPGTPADSGDARLYVVCDGCGFFYGDVRLYPEMTVMCPECGSEAAWAFPKMDTAIERSAQIKDRNRVKPDASWGT